MPRNEMVNAIIGQRFFALVLIYIFLPTTCGKDYNGHKIYKISHSCNAKLLQNFIVKYGLEVLYNGANYTHILSPPQMQQNLEDLLNSLQLNYTTNGDVQQRITLEKIHRRGQAQNFFDEIQPLESIQIFLDTLTELYPDIVDYFSIGETYEGKSIIVAVISKGMRPKPKLIFIQAGIHAREWAAPSTALYILKSIAENYNSIDDMLRDIEINIVPVVNPDGYAFSFSNDRLWRKNREPNENSACIGTDLNRNYDVVFNASENNNPCESSYGGRKPFSTVETAALANYLDNNQHRLRAFIDLHSFGKYIFYPFGFEQKLYYRKELHEQTANKMAAAIETVRGTKYEIGTAADLIYATRGSSDDYAAAVLKCPIVFTIELPDNDFIVEPQDIQPIGKETSVGIFELVKIVSEMDFN